MFETIIQFNTNQYPFDLIEDQPNLKLETLIECKDSNDFVEHKKKFQIFKNIKNPWIICLNQIFQQSLTIHLIYQHVPTSLKQYSRQQIQTYQQDNLLGFKKSILQTVYFQLMQLTQCLRNNKIATNLRYLNIGVQKQQNNSQNNKVKLKYYVGNEFRITDQILQLQQFYLSQRKRILYQLQEDLQLGKRADCLPNFIIKGNKVIFTDEISQTKTRKRRSQSPERGTRFRQKQFKTNARQSNHPKGSPKPKKQHKYSCNFEEENLNFEFDKDNLNKSFESEDNEGYSITKTRSMKIQVEHQKPNKKNRKNSVKFKITTFEQISIDQSIDQKDKNFQDQQTVFQTYEQNQQNTSVNKNNKQEKKDYKQKVKQAKKKAEALLTKYMKVKNKSCYK